VVVVLTSAKTVRCACTTRASMDCNHAWVSRRYSLVDRPAACCTAW
jgi:hypothetical protein